VLLYGSNMDQQHLDCQGHLRNQLFLLLLLLLFLLLLLLLLHADHLAGSTACPTPGVLHSSCRTVACCCWLQQP
jgi:hypothetical protein